MKEDTLSSAPMAHRSSLHMIAGHLDEGILFTWRNTMKGKQMWLCLRVEQGPVSECRFGGEKKLRFGLVSRYCDTLSNSAKFKTSFSESPPSSNQVHVE